jgi:hypothetical protein
MFPAAAMFASSAAANRHDGRLWAFAFTLSLAVNALIAIVAGISILELRKFQPTPELAQKTPPAESVRFIAPESADERPPTTAPDAEPPPQVEPAKGFARTSEDQAADRPEQPSRIGERNTRATSDATPDPTAPALPAQAGVEPLAKGHIETTESRYQDGILAPDAPVTPDQPAPPMPPQPVQPPMPPESSQRGGDPDSPGKMDKTIPPPPLERLATSADPVDVPVAKPEPDESPVPRTPAPPEMPKEGTPDAPPEPDDIKETKPAPPPLPTTTQPPFRGHQRKTTLRGSISRTGRSALDVEDSPLGRYQAAISRAVELEWQRNCVRYRDFITPGFLTVRFSVDPKGNVKGVDFVGSMQSGQQQKGFTLNAIREADIPPMPPELGREYKDESLELIFNFYF